VQHREVYRDPNRYAGWPANYGIWSWGDEIVVGFTIGYPSREGGFHARDRTRPFDNVQARSLDGGETWQIEPFPGHRPGGRGLSADEHMLPGMGVGAILDGEEAPRPCPGEIDFQHPDFALMAAKTGLVAGARSFFYVSFDRCRSWQGPYSLPMYSPTGVAARTDYIVSGPRTCTLFLTANKRDDGEGRVLCARTTDGGRSFPLLSWIGPEPEGYAIMPSSVALGPGRFLVAVRRSGPRDGAQPAPCWIELWRSDDDGHTWRYAGRPVPDTGLGGNPPALLRLLDGRLCLIYGHRAPPFGIQARLSEDEGATWSAAIPLRTDGGCHDLGYPRAVQRPDGTVVIVYYFNDRPDGERYIAATLWRP